MPIKCPVAPLEFCFLADWYFTERGVRDQVPITYATPLDGAFTKPIAAGQLGGMLEDRGIELVTEFNTHEVDPGGRLVGYDGREIPFDLGLVIPLHGGATYVGRSPGLGGELDFVPTDEHTLQSKAAQNIFVIGDAANVPASKAGRSLTSRARPSSATCAGSWPANRSSRGSTAAPIASSRPGSAKRYSSTSTTTRSRSPATT